MFWKARETMWEWQEEKRERICAVSDSYSQDEVTEPSAVSSFSPRYYQKLDCDLHEVPRMKANANEQENMCW